MSRHEMIKKEGNLLNLSNFVDWFQLRNEELKIWISNFFVDLGIVGFEKLYK